ncbi:MAG: SIS domain-containing protein [Bryobacteraceae bacterium]|nr:SIS domain-containing protein [Bryobacteraceae bacterium]
MTSSKPRLIEGPYLRDLLRQPGAVRDTIGALAHDNRAASLPLRASRARRFVLTGMGSSLHALHPLCARLNAAGRPAAMVETGELLRYHPNALHDAALVVVSQSGRSAEIVRLARRRLDSCVVIGVTNAPDSPLARRADAVVLMAAGEESTVSCKTYLATLAALAWLGDALCGAADGRALTLLEKAVPTIESYLTAWKDHVRSLARLLRGVDSLFLAGRGDSLAAASTGGLIIKEAAHFHAEGMSAPQFRHGPFEMLGRRIMVLVFAGAKPVRKLNLRLADDIRLAGGQSQVIGEDAAEAVFQIRPPSEIARPLLEILPVQMITLALAAAAGREAGRFERASKITRVE